MPGPPNQRHCKAPAGIDTVFGKRFMASSRQSGVPLHGVLQKWRGLLWQVRRFLCWSCCWNEPSHLATGQVAQGRGGHCLDCSVGRHPLLVPVCILQLGQRVSPWSSFERCSSRRADANRQGVDTCATRWLVLARRSNSQCGIQQRRDWCTRWQTCEKGGRNSLGSASVPVSVSTPLHGCHCRLHVVHICFAAAGGNDAPAP